MQNDINDPTRYDLPDTSEWEGSRLADICEVFGIGPAADCLRSIDRHGEEGCTVSVKLPNGECLYVPDDLEKIRALEGTEPVAAWIVHGIAGDGSDWEWSEQVAAAEDLDGALARFADALLEHSELGEAL